MFNAIRSGLNRKKDDNIVHYNIDKMNGTKKLALQTLMVLTALYEYLTLHLNEYKPVNILQKMKSTTIYSFYDINEPNFMIKRPLQIFNNRYLKIALRGATNHDWPHVLLKFRTPRTLLGLQMFVLPSEVAPNDGREGG